MKNIYSWIFLLCILAGLGFYFFEKTKTEAELNQELTAIKSELASTKITLEAEQKKIAVIEDKLKNTRTGMEFLSLALCPKIEFTKDAPCVKNSTEWMSDTIQAGSNLSNPEIKSKMDALLFTLGEKKQPSAKEFYELLRPIEVSILQDINNNLK